MDYKHVAKEVLKFVGGKENVSHLEHCSTRLRFSLIDNKKANVEELKKIPGVIVVKMTGQCQVVIGNEVIEVYDEVIKLMGPSFGNVAQSNTQQISTFNKIYEIFYFFYVHLFIPLKSLVFLLI